MLELGAGFGRWGIRGALAAKQRGIRDIRARFVDGEPQHVSWIRDALTLNGLNDIDTSIVEAAASYAGQPIPFVVAMQDHDARSWYGQAVGRPAGLVSTERTYFGHRVHELSGGNAIYVNTVTFEEIAAGLDVIDFVDMDLQGAELELIENAAELFSRKVRRVHIGTHGSEIEDKLRRIFKSEGWIPQWDFPLQTRVETELGPVFFNDGVQGWINPRLSRARDTLAEAAKGLRKTMPEPVFSFVATSRNDDHGGDVLRRTQSFIRRLGEQALRHEVRCELVLVDWNPPQGRAPLADVLAWPAGSEWFSARVITVPPALHRELAFSKRLAMFQMIAKNVGIRRARGAYMIATNIDIIFSDELFHWLKSGEMREGALYRSDRWDIPNEIQLEPDFDTLLARAHGEHIRRNLSSGTHIRRDSEFINTYGNRFDHSVYYPMEGILMRLKAGIAKAPGLGRDDLLQSLDTIIKQDLPQLRRDFFIPVLHTNGCGDFTMMSRRDWFALRGYPEWQVFSWNIDSVIVYQAHYNGIAIEELDASRVHYHIEHDNGSGWTPEGAESLWSRLAERGLPLIDYRQFYQIIYALQDNAEAKRLSVYNDADWGFAERDIECRVLAEPGRPPRPPIAVNESRLDEDFLKELVAASPGLRFDAGERAADGVTAEWRSGEDGAAEIAVESLPATWSYAYYYDLPTREAHSGEFWVRIALIVDRGNVVVGILNRDQTDFLSQVTCKGAGPRLQQVFAHIREIGAASRVVLRNVTADNEPARFRLKSIELLREDYGAEDAAMDRRRGDDDWLTAASFALRQEDGAPAAEPDAVAEPGELAREPIEPAETATVGFAQIRPETPAAIVRVLRGPQEPSPAASQACQAMIILPAAGADTARAVVDLGAAGPEMGTVVVDLHVLEGEVALGLRAGASGELLAERRERAGGPLTRIELDLGTNLKGAIGAGVLVIANASRSGPAKLLLHRLAFERGDGALRPLPFAA